MAKLTALTAMTVLATGDIAYAVDDPGGTPLSRKITWDNIFNGMLVFPATLAQNDLSYIDLNNTTDGTGAGVGIRFDANAGGGHVYATAPSFTPAGSSIADAFHVVAFSESSGGLVLGTTGDAPITFSTWGEEAMRILAGGNESVVIGDTTADGKLSVDQAESAGAIPVLELDQADVSEQFIKYIGESAADVSMSFADAADLTTPGAIVGWAKVQVEDVAGAGAITDGDYWQPFYADPTA